MKQLEFAMLSLESMDWVPAYKAASEYGIDTSQLEYLLTLMPAERVKRRDAALVFVLAARKAGIKYYGFDPRSPEASQ
jgi:hypothetical protein